jgi:hypothetical protein
MCVGVCGWVVQAIKLEQSDVKLGDLVNVIGYPRGGEKICITKG